MRVLLLGLLVCLAASAAEASTWPWRMARRMAELPVSKPTPECAALSDADFQSSWQLLDEKCPKSAPFLCATTSDCWRALEALGYKCAKAAARAAANGTDVDAAVDRIKNLYRSNPTAMINWDKEERPVPVPSPPPSPSPPAEPGPPPGNETAGNETAASQSAAGVNGTEVVAPAVTGLATSNATGNAAGSTSAAEQEVAKKKEEAAAAAKKKQEEAAAAAAAKKKQEEAAAAAAAKKQEEEAAQQAAAQQAAAAAAAAAAAKQRPPSPKPKASPGRSPAPKQPIIPATGGAGGTYTRAQVATHNTATNCWYIFNNRVVNVTPYLTTNRHPGGNAVIVRYCGKDATGAFNSAHRTGPAVAQQEAYMIGTLAA